MSSTSEKRASQYKRKPPSSTTTLVDLELGDASSDRYPPFDLDDPFASLTELRRRSRSYTCILQGASDLHHPTDTAPFDLPQLSPKAFPSEIQRRYTLTVALPSPLSLSDADTSRSDDLGTENIKQREAALAKLTDHESSGIKKAVDTDTVSSSSRDASLGRTSHQEHHCSYTHISMLFRPASPAQSPQNGRRGMSTRSHYIPRKVSSLSYMYTPPLTPDVSGTSSSSSSSLFDPAMMYALNDERDAIPPPPKSPTPSTHSFVKKLLTKRSASVLPPFPRSKESLDAKDLPSLPPSPTPGAKRDAENATGVPFPRSSAQASVSDVTLSPKPYYEKPKTTLSIIGASPQPAIIYSRLLPAEREVDGYATASETRLPPGAELDAGLVPPKKHKLFNFSSRSLLRSRVDLYEAADEVGRKIDFSEFAKAEFDEFALPTPKQLLIAASLSVVSESGVRVRFGDIWEKEKTAVIFIRHFRASACQDYLRSIGSDVDVEALERAGLRIVIIGMGAPSLITPYRQLTGVKFPIYTDPTLAVHHALGMTLRSSNRGSATERGHYITSPSGAFGSLRRTLAGATRLPLFERAGDTAQLGGEFVLGPGASECAFAHHMRTTRAHTPIVDVVVASGVQTARTRRLKGMRMRIGGEVKGEGEDESVRRVSMEDEDAWMARRRRSLVRLRKKRQRRRAGIGAIVERVPLPMPSDVDEASKMLARDSNRYGRFAAVEEELDEDGDDVYDVTFGIQ